ncbi:acyltransferase family protein [Smaragdicoccus niigatensis]
MIVNAFAPEDFRRSIYAAYLETVIAIEAGKAVVKPAGLKRDRSIDALRGLAAIFVVAHHVIGESVDRGMGVGNGTIWRYFEIATVDLRMPLFTVLSGLVYGLRPIHSTGDLPSLLRGKRRRLLYPMVTVGTVVFLLQVYVPGTNSKPELSSFWRIYVFGFEHLWFLQSIFIIFVIVGLLDAFDVMRDKWRWQAVTATAFGAALVFSVPAAWDIFSLNGLLRLLPFFLAGYGLARYSREFDWRDGAGWFVAFVAVYSLDVMKFLGHFSGSHLARTSIAIGVGLTGVMVLFSIRHFIECKPLIWLGGYSMTVYLLHGITAPASRILLEQVGITSDPIVFICGLVAGIGGPIVFYLLFARFKLIRVYFLGEKALPPAKAKVQSPTVERPTVEPPAVQLPAKVEPEPQS